MERGFSEPYKQKTPESSYLEVQTQLHCWARGGCAEMGLDSELGLTTRSQLHK